MTRLALLTCLAAATLAACSYEEAEVVPTGAGGKADQFEASYSLTQVHPIAQYSQSDPRWGAEKMYDGACRTLSQAGCAITSHAMLGSYYGGTRDPLQQSSCLAAAGSHSGCNIVWSGCTPEGVTYLGHGSGKLSAIREDLDAGYPVIAFVRRKGKSSCSHFVLVSGYTAPGTSYEQIEIIDPAGGVRRRLSHFAAVCSTRRFSGEVPASGELSWREPLTGFCEASGCDLSVKATGAIARVKFYDVETGELLALGRPEDGRLYRARVRLPAGTTRVRAWGYTVWGKALVSADRLITAVR